MKRLLVGSLLVLALVAVAVAAPDLSGTWVIDKTKSDAGRGGQVQDVTMVIKQSGNDLAITTKRDMGGQPMNQEAKYTLDGKESKNPGGRGGESVSKATVEGD